MSWSGLKDAIGAAGIGNTFNYRNPTASGVSPETGGWDPETSQLINQANIQQNVSDTNPFTRYANARYEGMNSPTSISDKFSNGDLAGALGQYRSMSGGSGFQKLMKTMKQYELQDEEMRKQQEEYMQMNEQAKRLNGFSLSPYMSRYRRYF